MEVEIGIVYVYIKEYQGWLEVIRTHKTDMK
jgi:hypothetical protein